MSGVRVDASRQEILGFGYYDKYAREAETLRLDCARRGRRSAFVSEVFEHDKRSPQSKGSAVNWRTEPGLAGPARQGDAHGGRQQGLPGEAHELQLIGST
jgi:hypothetical protein